MTHVRRLAACAALIICAWMGGACDEPTEAPRVQLPVVVSAQGVAPVTTDLGYDVRLTSARVALSGVVFTVAGEEHAGSMASRVYEALVPSARAHPGHYQGGEVTGELAGAFVIDWIAQDARELGVATLLAGTYNGANFTFERAGELAGDDALPGHTAVLQGTATRQGAVVSFTIVLDSPAGRVLVGAPFEAAIDEDTTGTLALHFNTSDVLEGDTLFDGIDFSTLDADADGQLLIQPDEPAVEDAYNTVRRAFQTHDHYAVTLEN